MPIPLSAAARPVPLGLRRMARRTSTSTRTRYMRHASIAISSYAGGTRYLVAFLVYPIDFKFCRRFSRDIRQTLPAPPGTLCFVLAAGLSRHGWESPRHTWFLGLAQRPTGNSRACLATRLLVTPPVLSRTAHRPAWQMTAALRILMGSKYKPLERKPTKSDRAQHTIGCPCSSCIVHMYIC
jgi:hypothetical protein